MFLVLLDVETPKLQKVIAQVRRIKTNHFVLKLQTNTVEFAVLPPGDSDEQGQGFGLKTIAVPPSDLIEDEQPEPMPLPRIEEESRISITCKNADKPTSNDAVDNKSVKSLARFTIGLEESSTDGSVGYESRSFYYDCGKEGAFVSISNLSSSSKYELSALYENAAGVATHKGSAVFVLSENEATTVELFMKRITGGNGSVDVDVIFDRDQKPKGCEEIDVECPDIYAPVVCQGTATPFDGRDIALVVGPQKAENECIARALLRTKACSLEAELMPEISCKKN